MIFYGFWRGVCPFFKGRVQNPDFGPDPSTAAGLAPALVYMFLGTPGRIGTRNVEIIYRSGFPVSGMGCYFMDSGEVFAYYKLAYF